MKIELDLDMNKLDYDEINKQIAEKIAALDIKDMYDINCRVDRAIETKIKDDVEFAYHNYIYKYWDGDDGSTAEGIKVIKDVCKSEIEERTKTVVNNIFNDLYTDDALKEIMMKIIPDIFAYAMFARMDKAIYESTSNYRDEMHSIMRSEIESRINRLRY